MSEGTKDANEEVWYSSFPLDTENLASVSLSHPQRDTLFKQDSLLTYSESTWPDDVPLPLFNMDYTDPLGSVEHSLPDIFTVHQAIIVSKWVRDLLLDCEMGRNELLEVQIFEQNRQVQISGRWFALRILERHSRIDLGNSDTGTKVWPRPPSGDHALIKTIKKNGKHGWMYRPGVREHTRAGISIYRSPNKHVDLWLDPLLKNSVVFVSTNLKQKIESADLNVKSLSFAPASMTEQES